MVLAIGGDGTALAAIRAAAPRGRPVLAAACGSLGALTSVPATEIEDALVRFARGEWRARALPALELRHEDGQATLAYNDVAFVRRGEGQVRTTMRVDGTLYSRIAGDGCIISTAVGSSAYALAAGGPLLAPGADAFLFTPLPSHGGACPPLVIGGGSRLEIEVMASFKGTRLEVDGKLAYEQAGSLAVRLIPDRATVVAFEDQEPFLEGLRRRGLITDSPRILAEDRQAG